MTLRKEIQKHQHVGPLGEVSAAFYRARNLLINECFTDHPLDRELPLISLALDGPSWRGKYESIGPFGIEDVITINVSRFDTGLDACQTLAHELSHWGLYPLKGHGENWRIDMAERFGLIATADGESTAAGAWHDLTAMLYELGLDTFRLRA